MALTRSITLIHISLILILTSCGFDESKPATSADVIQFRQVLSVGTSLSGLEFDGVRYENIDCLNPATKVEPAKVITACGKDDDFVYLLSPTFLDGNSIESAKAEFFEDEVWIVSISFDANGTKKFGEITSRVTSLAAPQNQIAISSGNLVITAPSINEEILEGNAQITGNFTQQEAESLANSIKNREPLPDFLRKRQ